MLLFFFLFFVGSQAISGGSVTVIGEAQMLVPATERLDTMESGRCSNFIAAVLMHDFFNDLTRGD